MSGSIPAFRRTGKVVWSLALMLITGRTPSVAQLLYDAALGTLPAAQGWSFAGLGAVNQTLTNNLDVLDTSALASTQAGYALVIPTVLNRTNGFSLRFHAQLNVEAHTSTNRAGFSLIALADDRRGIELGFWTNHIFAQTDQPLFTHGEDVEFSTTADVVDYSLSLLATNYILRASGVPILAGPIRDYTAFNGFPNPYRTPNFCFLGDDTSSAAATVSIADVTLVPAPTLVMPAAGVLSWQGIPKQTYTVETTTDLINWSVLGSVTAPTATYWFTNAPTDSLRFFRLAHE